MRNTSIPIPGTFWELKIKTVEENRNNDAPYSHNRLIIRDIKSGAWHYLTDQDMYLGEIKIDWCGDIDGDKIPDLMLTDMSDHGMGTMLFLSKNAGKWKYLKLAGVYYWGDCC